MYAKTEPQEMYKILKKYDASYMILEDSICLSPRPCSTPYLLDLANGHVSVHFCINIMYGIHLLQI